MIIVQHLHNSKIGHRAHRTILNNLLLNTAQKGYRRKACTRNQETKNLIITFKVKTIRIQSFKGSHPLVFSYGGVTNLSFIT